MLHWALMTRSILKAASQPNRSVKRAAAPPVKIPGPVLITDSGRPPSVLVDVETWNGVQRRIEVLEAIARGERAFAEGRMVAHAAARKRLRRWLVPQS